MKQTPERVRDFLSHKRIAVVGVSRSPRAFSAMVFREFVARGYDAVPVNPGAAEIAGRPAFKRVQDVQPPVEAALVMTNPAVTEQAVRDCADAGLSEVWIGRGAVSKAAVDACQQRGIEPVAGLCPYMFFENTGLIHRIHRFFAPRA